ncbi:hypothetical protein ACH4SP_25785 [Streptomyces sp. NPDC021093]|uniref:hypothetical protein n=1 Tax=Streptomyces sp. NPDC021093 TaxID=3365112 RepID=UPI003789EFAB
MSGVGEGHDPEEYWDIYVRKSAFVRGHRQELSTDAQEALGRAEAERAGKKVRRVWKDIASGYKDV